LKTFVLNSNFQDRDISEKIALGLPDSRARASGETQFDARLFNQTGVCF